MSGSVVSVRGVICAGVVLFLAARPAVGDENPTVAVTGPTGPVMAGGPVSFFCNALNTSTQQVSWRFPADIECRLVSPKATATARAHLREGEEPALTTIPPGAFARREYVLSLPDSWTGETTVEFRDTSPTRWVFQVQTPPPATTNQPPESAWLHFLKGARWMHPGEPYDPDTFFKEHIFGYEPMYFIAGAKSPNVKFEISFKYRLLNDHGWLAKREPWLTGLHLAYTQVSLWDLNGPSSPFYDTSYMPELLYYWRGVAGGGPTNWFRFDFEGGFHHESNGKSGTDSRSLNEVYLRPAFVFGRDNHLQLTLMPRVWEYVGDLSDNPDMPDYRGYADLRAVLGWQRGLQVSALGRMGKDGDHRSLQLDATYPLMQAPAGSFSIYLMAQYFTGYGESLLGYREKTEEFRAGISLYR